MTYRVFVEKDPDNGFKATALGWPDCTVSAETREKALTELRVRLQDRLAAGEIVDLDLDVATKVHPWLRHTEVFRDNPLFDEVVEEIAAYRRELDAEADEK